MTSDEVTFTTRVRRRAVFAPELWETSVDSVCDICGFMIPFADVFVVERHALVHLNRRATVDEVGGR